jgi:hypothetical protein
MVPPLNTVNVGSNSPATLLFGASGNGNGNIQVVNKSDSVSIWLSNTSNCMAYMGMELDPGASTTFDGSTSIYAITASGTAPIAIIPGGLSYSPGNTSAIILNDVTSYSVQDPTPYTTNVYSVQNFSSYSLAIKAYCSSQGTVNAPLIMPVQLNWFADAAGTFLLEIDTYWMWVANGQVSAFNSPLLGGGPAKGAYLSITFTSVSNVAIPIFIPQISILGNNRSQSANHFYQTVPTIMSGILRLPSVNPAQLMTNFPNGSDGILANEQSNATIAANGTNWLPMPLFSGQVSCRFTTSTPLANDFVMCTAAGLMNGQVQAGTAAQGVIWNPGNVAATEYTTILNLGNAPTYAVFKATATPPIISLEIQGPTQ